MVIFLFPIVLLMLSIINVLLSTNLSSIVTIWWRWT